MLDEGLIRLVQEVLFSIAHSTEEEKREFYNRLLELDPGSVDIVYEVACLHMLGRWHKVEEYMESLFTKDPARTPREVVNMVCIYKRVKRKMTPFLIKLARKVKDRVRKRNERAPHDEGERDE